MGFPEDDGGELVAGIGLAFPHVSRLEDVLAAGGSTSEGRKAGSRDLAEILADWPTEFAAVEYFLGTEQAWVFVISPSGQVAAHALTDDQGGPLPSRKLVAQVRRILSDINQQARKMRPRLLAGVGFDHTWQDDLHTFCRELLPAPAVDELGKARTVLVVPSHILHYCPFAALVVERDPQVEPDVLQVFARAACQVLRTAFQHGDLALQWSD